MGTINVMASHLGHGVISTDGNAMTSEEIIEKLKDPIDGRKIETDTESSKAFFNEMLGKGYVASKKVGDGQHEHIREYDPEADILFRTQNIGG